jgi:hypothetical protein
MSYALKPHCHMMSSMCAQPQPLKVRVALLQQSEPGKVGIYMKLHLRREGWSGLACQPSMVAMGGGQRKSLSENQKPSYLI